jgi:hypothetical protein
MLHVSYQVKWFKPDFRLYNSTERTEEHFRLYKAQQQKRLTEVVLQHIQYPSAISYSEVNYHEVYQSNSAYKIFIKYSLKIVLQKFLQQELFLTFPDSGGFNTFLPKHHPSTATYFHQH